MRLADELNVSVAKALRFIDDVGYTRASKLADEGARADGLLSKRLPSGWWKPAASVGIVGTTGVVGYKYLSLQQAKAVADAAASDSDRADTAAAAVRTVLDRDDLTPKQKKEMIDRILGVMEDTNAKGAGAGLLGGDTQTLVVLLIVLALVFNYAMEGD